MRYFSCWSAFFRPRPWSLESASPSQFGFYVLWRHEERNWSIDITLNRCVMRLVIIHFELYRIWEVKLRKWQSFWTKNWLKTNSQNWRIICVSTNCNRTKQLITKAVRRWELWMRTVDSCAKVNFYNQLITHYILWDFVYYKVKLAIGWTTLVQS